MHTLNTLIYMYIQTTIQWADTQTSIWWIIYYKKKKHFPLHSSIPQRSGKKHWKKVRSIHTHTFQWSFSFDLRGIVFWSFCVWFNIRKATKIQRIQMPLLWKKILFSFLYGPIHIQMIHIYMWKCIHWLLILFFVL